MIKNGCSYDKLQERLSGLPFKNKELEEETRQAVGQLLDVYKRQVHRIRIFMQMKSFLFMKFFFQLSKCNNAIIQFFK